MSIGVDEKSAGDAASFVPKSRGWNVLYPLEHNGQTIKHGFLPRSLVVGFVQDREKRLSHSREITSLPVQQKGKVMKVSTCAETLVPPKVSSGVSRSLLSSLAAIPGMPPRIGTFPFSRSILQVDATQMKITMWHSSKFRFKYHKILQEMVSDKFFPDITVQLDLAHGCV